MPPPPPFPVFFLGALDVDVRLADVRATFFFPTFGGARRGAALGFVAFGLRAAGLVRFSATRGRLPPEDLLMMCPLAGFTCADRLHRAEANVEPT